LAAGVTQVGIAQDAKRKQLRAYLHMIPGTVDEQNPATNFRMQAKPFIINKGQTPAYDVQYHATMRVIQTVPNGGLPIGYDVSLPDHLGAQSRATIGPEQTNFITAVAEGILSESELQQVKGVVAGTSRLFVFGTVNYTDAFKKERYTEFCWMLVWNGADVFWMSQDEGQDAT
jgi:hypothetical protein